MPAKVGDESSVHLDSSWRKRAPEETLVIAEGLMPALGISRVTDITRMDRLGLPVYASVRPRGKTLRVHAGKGLRPIDARVSALMEALEFAVAEPERSRWTLQHRTVAQIMAPLDGRFEFVDLIPFVGVPVALDRPLPVVACEELQTGTTALVPAELVFVPLELEPSARLFGASTHGLASGNTLEEATLHGLFEVLEYDATSMRKARDDSLWVDPRHYPGSVRQLTQAWREIGVELAVRQVLNEFALPCFVAVLHEPTSTSVNLAEGSALHVDPAIAMTRAICEAAQSRLSVIHGGRDDIIHFYAKYTDLPAASRIEAEAKLVAGLFDTTRAAGPEDFPNRQGAASEPSDLLTELLERLARLGFDTVFRYRYAIDLSGLHVVRVIVPKCEHFERASRRVGRRLLARILGDA